jgi:hypothetical protein
MSPGEGRCTFPGSLDGISGHFQASDGTSDFDMNSLYIEELFFERRLASSPVETVFLTPTIRDQSPLQLPKGVLM